MPEIRETDTIVKKLLEKTAHDSRAWKIPPSFFSEAPLTLSFLNAHAVTTATRNSSFYNILMDSDYLLRDGIGVKIALKIFNLGETENLNGTDLISLLLPYYNGKKLAIFGASDAALAACRHRLEVEGIRNIVAMEHGFHENAFYLKICEELKPDIVLLCMGMPKQELLAAELKVNNRAGLIICGGGWADFYSGLKIRAPEWIRALSLEWLHRLYREPKRLGKRYTIDVLYYFYLIFRARIAKGQ